MAEQFDTSIHDNVAALITETVSTIIEKAEQDGQSLSQEQALEMAKEVLSLCVDVSTPLVAWTEYQLISIDVDWSSGRNTSVKPTNIILQPTRLLEAVASGGANTLAAISAPLYTPLFLVVLICSLFRIANIELSEREAAVITVMWHESITSKTIPEDRLLKKLNEEMAKENRQVADLREMQKILGHLENMRCAEMIGGEWLLREEVRIQI